MRRLIHRLGGAWFDAWTYVLCLAFDLIESGKWWLVAAVFIVLVAIAWVIELSGALGCVGNWRECLS